MRVPKKLILVLTAAYLSMTAQITNNLKMVWNDEFNGNTLDASKWSPAPAWNRQGGSYWSDDNFEMTGNGQVKISVTERNDSVFCGAIRTHNKFDKKYGYFEVRCKVPQLKGGWAAFWMMPYGNRPGNQGNDGTEIDIFESINGWQGKINHALHWDGYGSEHKKEAYRFDRPDLYDNNYHKFGVLWTPDEYIFYIDDQETWRTTAGGVSDVNQYLKLTMEVASGWWAGNWDDQITKPIEWLVDYVRVYDYQPIVEQNVNLSFQLLSNHQTFEVGDHVKMHVEVSGALDQLDEIRFYTQRDNQAEILKKTAPITSSTTYWYNWFPDQAGNYQLKAAGFKNGAYVTNVAVTAAVNDTVSPLSLNFTSLNSGDTYTQGESVKMDVQLSGDLSDANEIQYLAKKGDGAFEILKTENINLSPTHDYNWVPSEPGSYTLRVTALLNGQYVTHVVAGAVNVEAATDPLSLSFTSLLSGSTYQITDEVPMHVDLTGNLSQANEIQFLVRKDGEDFKVIKTTTLSEATHYLNHWLPETAGTYSFRVTALNNGNYVTHVVVGSVVVQDPLVINYTLLQTGTTYNLGEKVKMHVELSGDYSNIDELRFIAINSAGASSVLKSTVVTADQSFYTNRWTPNDTGIYKLKVSAYNNGSYVRHIKAIVNIENPIRLNYTVLENGQSYAVGEDVKMHIRVSGDFAQADEIKFIVQKSGGKNTVDKITAIDPAKQTYYNKWVPEDPGEYILKAKAYLAGEFVTKKLVNITVEAAPNFKVLKTTEVANQEIEAVVYPNPVTDYLTIVTEAQIISYSVLNQWGQILFHGNGASVDVSRLSAGNYSLIINSRIVTKFVKE